MKRTELPSAAQAADTPDARIAMVRLQLPCASRELRKMFSREGAYAHATAGQLREERARLRRWIAARRDELASLQRTMMLRKAPTREHRLERTAPRSPRTAVVRIVATESCAEGDADGPPSSALAIGRRGR